jgi:hypothetical protein
MDGRSVAPFEAGSVLNRTAGEETLFTVLYGAEADLAGAPVLTSRCPRWWLEIKCVLRDD